MYTICSHHHKQPTSVKAEVWAAFSESPVASLFLNEGQVNKARSNVILSMFHNFPALQEQEKTAFTAIQSFENQIQVANNHIEGNINTLRQKHPDSFAGLNINPQQPPH